MKQKEIVITNNPNIDKCQIIVKLFPEDKTRERKTPLMDKLVDEIDIVQLCLKDIDGNELPIKMTPDEALEIAGLLTQGVSLYLRMYNKEYKSLIGSRIRILNKLQKKN